VTDILADRKRPEAEVREAAAVLAQVTAPWVEEIPPLPELTDHLPSLVSSLTSKYNVYNNGIHDKSKTERMRKKARSNNETRVLIGSARSHDMPQQISVSLF